MGTTYPLLLKIGQAVGTLATGSSIRSIPDDLQVPQFEVQPDDLQTGRQLPWRPIF